MVSATSGLDAQSGLIDHLKAVSIFGAAFCLVMTLGRLYVRRGRWWWDDYVASFSMTAMIFSTVTVNLHLLYDSWLTHPQSIRVALFYLFNLGFYITMWSFRISVLLAFIRLGIFKPVLYLFICICCIMGAILCAQVVWTCEAQLAWKLMMMPSCSLGRAPAIVNVSFSVVADAALLFTPLIALWHLRTVEFAHRIRLCVTFGSNILVTISCMVHSAYVLKKGGLDLVLVTVLQLTIAIIVCNLPVVSAALHRLWSRQNLIRWKSKTDKVYCAEITFTKNNNPSFGGCGGSKHGSTGVDDVGIFSTFIDFTSSTESLSPMVDIGVGFPPLPQKPPRVVSFRRSLTSSSVKSSTDPHGVPVLMLPPFDDSPLLDVEEVIERGRSLYYVPSLRTSRTVSVTQHAYLPV